MLNRTRTLEVFGYDLDPSIHRRTNSAVATTGKTLKKDLVVIDNCPGCNIERQVQLRQSKKNKLCSKCFHATPVMQLAKQNQNKIKSEETRRKMSENHWSTKGIQSAFKGKRHTTATKETLASKIETYYKDNDYDVTHERYIKASCTLRGIPLEEFDGFSAPEGTRIRQSAEGKAWSYDVLAKANFTCQKCNARGGQLHAHHKNAFASYPDERFDVNNGACLCLSCHDEFHLKYGKGNNTKEQFELWI